MYERLSEVEAAAGVSVNHAPVEAAPSDPVPNDLATPIDPTPVGHAPVGTAPVDTTASGTAPVGTAPVGSTRVGPAPVDPAPVDPAPIGSAPVDLAAVLVAVGGLGADGSDADLIDQIRLLEHLKSACAAAQAHLTHTFHTSQKADGTARHHHPDDTRRSTAAQIALARRDSRHTGNRHLGLAHALNTDMPHTLNALRRGDLSERRAQLIAEQFACLTPHHRRAADTLIAPDLPTLGDHTAQTCAAGIAARLDPEAVLGKIRGAVKDRHVSIRPAPDTMTRLSALLPVAQGVAIYAALRQHADATINRNTESRNRSQIMADTLVGRVTGQNITGCDPYGIPHYTKPHHHGPADRTQHPDPRPTADHTPADHHDANHTGGPDTGSSPAGDATDLGTNGAHDGGPAATDDRTPADDAADLGTNGAHDGGRAAADDRSPANSTAAEARSADTNTASAEATSTGTDSTKVTGAAEGRSSGTSTDTASAEATSTDTDTAQLADAGSHRAGDSPGGDRPAGESPATDFPADGVSATHKPRAAVCATGTPHPPGLHLNLIMTDRTLLGDDNEPAHLIGHGPIPAALARSLVLGHTDNPTTTWIRRLYTNPTGTQLLTCDAKQRIFPDTAKEFLIARDQICRTPWCDAPIRHLDHIVPYAQGGPTTTDNGEGLCESCNYTKQAPDWHSTTDNDGAIHTTTPTGHTYTNTPPTPPKPSPWPDISTCETFLTHALLYVA